MKGETRRRHDLAVRITDALERHTTTQAVLLVGSTASDDADELSDLDLIAYHDELPDERAIAAVRHALGDPPAESIGGSRDDGGFAETWRIDGVECQIAFHTIAKQEHNLAVVLEKHDPTTPLHKMMSGLLEGVSLCGSDTVEVWKSRAASYPDALARAVVEHHLRFFPLWYAGERVVRSDALLWHYQERVEALQNLLGVLAGLNRRYYSTFQFKRMRRFIASMEHVPTALAERLERVLTAEPIPAGAELESLVRDTLALVDAHMPEVSTERARRFLGRRQRA